MWLIIQVRHQRLELRSGNNDVVHINLQVNAVSPAVTALAD